MKAFGGSFALEHAVLAAMAIPPGADMSRIRDDFAILGLSSALGLDPTMKAAMALRVICGTQTMDAAARRAMVRHTAVLRRLVKSREIQVRASERSVARSSHMSMRASAEKILAARVVSCEAARAASYHQTPSAMVKPLATALAARAWLKTVALLDVPKTIRKSGMTHTLKAEIAATNAAWIALAGADRSGGIEDTYGYLATELMEMATVVK